MLKMDRSRDENEIVAKRQKLDDEEPNKSENEEFDEEAITEDNPSKDANEARFGIVERINKTQFNGVIKSSIDDFIVNEIDQEGRVVRLTTFDLPEIEKPANEQPVDSLEEANERIKSLVGEEIFEKISKYFELNSRDESLKILAPKDKTARKSIHDYVKTNYKQFNTNTINEADQQFIEICHNRYNRSTMKDCYRNQQTLSFKYCTCALYKENIDTMQAINLIMKHLRINAKRISYAGTKDKKGKTTQLISFFKIEPKQILRLNNNFHNIKLGNFNLKNENGLKLGDLKGNRFTLVIRKVDEPNNDYITKGVESLKNNGFINYFGLQRFGNCAEIPTHMIGKFLILGEIQEAIKLILKPRENSYEKEEVKMARQVWTENNENVRMACSLIEKFNCVEKFLLNGLNQSKKTDFLGAFQFIPRNMRLMYLHAYQSFIWNCAATKRIQLYGYAASIGDLVRTQKEEILVLNEANVNEFKIEDVVLPLPGHSILYPENEIKTFYEDLMKKDSISAENLKNKIKDFSLCGDYRNVLVKPADVQCQIVNYKLDSDVLAQSDYDRLLKKEEKAEQLEKEDKPEKAIILEFNLPSSCYATMALREILKTN